MSGLPVDLYKWRAPGVRRQLADRLETGRFDVLLVDFLNAFGNVPSSATVPIVLFEHNVEYQIWKRLSRIETKWLRRVGLGAEWRRVRSWEAHACRIADLTIAVSERDRDELQQLAPGATIAAVPTGVDTDYFRPGERAEIPNRIAFSGSMDWYPNEDAMFFFVREVLPRVREAIPDASLVIVGRNPSQGVRKLEELPGVIVTGTVADVRPAIEEAALVVVPLRAGGGTRLKIFEALAMGKAVLSTSVGAEGLGVIAGCHLAVSDGAEALTRDVIELLKNPLRRRELGAAGRLLVESQYSWPTVAAGFERHLRSVRSARTLQPKQVRGST
jgi:glycosyltransferase involved in cell wall biosynthesis